MRFSLTSAVAVLPALSAAQGLDFEQYQAQFQNFLGQMGSYVPNPGRYDPIAAAEAKLGSMKLNVLTLENWKETLYDTVSADATKPEEWWILTTGGNRTCMGHCGPIEQAFNETAAKFALTPGAPHMGLLNCEDQPILCNAWSTGAANLWIIDLLPPPAEVDCYRKRLNWTTVTSEELSSYVEADKRDGFKLVESWFHPFNGKGTEMGLTVPFAYFVWAFNLIPSWLFMILISFGSRTMMSNRMGNHEARRQ